MTAVLKTNKMKDFVFFAAIVLISLRLGEARLTWINKEINPCHRAESPCKNGGTCVMYLQTQYRCSCPDDAYGQFCEITSSGAGEQTKQVTKTYECAVDCEQYNQRGNLDCNSASVVNGSTCVLDLSVKDDLLTKTGQIAACTNPIAQAYPVQDDWWSTSSEHSSCPAHYARYSYTGCNWRASDNNFYNQYLQVYFSKDVVVTQISIKPRQDSNSWIKSMKVYYHSGIAGRWAYWTDENGYEKWITVFGEEDRSSIRDEPKHLPVVPPFIANYVRLYVMDYHDYPSMRLEIYGCDYTAL